MMDQIRKKLQHENNHYRALHEKHEKLEHRLHELTQQKFMSDADQHEERDIKLHKLQIKQEMESMVEAAAQQS